MRFLPQIGLYFENPLLKSLHFGALGRWIAILKVLRILNSIIELQAALLVLLPDKETLAIIKLIATLQWIFLFENLDWFLTYQITWKILTRMTWITTLRCGDHLLSVKCQTSSNELNWSLLLRTEASQLHKLWAKLQWKKRWVAVSWAL